MELFIQLFDSSANAEGNRGAGTLVPPMAELAAPPVPLADMLSPDGSVLTKFLSDYADTCPPEQAQKFAELSRLVAEAEEDFEQNGERAKRLLDFVYTVV